MSKKVGGPKVEYKHQSVRGFVARTIAHLHECQPFEVLMIAVKEHTAL